MIELLHGKFILEVLEDEEFISVLDFNFLNYINQQNYRLNMAAIISRLVFKCTPVHVLLVIFETNPYIQ